jgi:predicted nucleic acid-binding protein
VSRELFVDTGAWVALRYKRDQHHARAKTLFKKARKEGLSFVTTDFVLAETVTLLKARGAIDQAVALGEAIRSGLVAKPVELTAERHARAWQLFLKLRDQPVGYVDCTSFAVMEQRSMRTAFGFDRDFADCGFELYA